MLKSLLGVPTDEEQAAPGRDQASEETDSTGLQLGGQADADQPSPANQRTGDQAVARQRQPAGPQEEGGLQHASEPSGQLSSASDRVARVLNLNRKDTQGVVPACLLIMNMTPIDRERDNPRNPPAKASTSNGADMAAVVKQPADFFSAETSLSKSKALNRRRKQMLAVLLQAKAPDGEMRVNLNNFPRKSLAEATETAPQGAQQQHPILYWAVFKYQFRLAIDLISKYGADPTVLNNNNSNLLHILFANFSHDARHAPELADLLVASNVSLNLVDKDGKSPLHVALKKQQLQALQYIHEHNISKRGALNQGQVDLDPAVLKRNSLELFDFECKIRNGASPLHYVVRKANYEAFLYVMQHQLVDCLSRDAD